MKFASTRIDILPSQAMPLSGFDARNAGSDTIGVEACDLKIAWLSLNENEQLLFFLADLLFFPKDLAALVEEHIIKNYGIAKSNLVFAGTHTHSAPAMGFTPKEPRQEKYMLTIFKKICDELPKLASQLSEASIQHATLDAPPVSINRRKVIRHWKTNFAKKALRLPNPDGPVSHKIKLIQFTPAQGRPTLFINYASHPVFNRNLKYSADYPGRLSELCLEGLSLGEVFCFQGFGGDVRPNFQGKSGLKAQLKEMVYGPDFADYTTSHFESFCQQLATCIQQGIAALQPIGPTSLTILEDQFKLASESEKTHRSLTLKAIKIAPGLNLLVANAEMFCHYDQLLGEHFFAIGCGTDPIGYIPSPEALRWGGYEVDQAPLNYGMDGPFAMAGLQEVEKRIKQFAKSA